MTRDEVTLIIHAPYFKYPRPELAEELLLSFRNGKQAATNIGINTMILAILESLPETEATALETKYRLYVQRARNVLKYASLNSVGWNDHHMSRWLLLGKEEDLEALRIRYVWTGQVGDLARWMINSMLDQCPEFKRVWRSQAGCGANPGETFQARQATQ